MGLAPAGAGREHLPMQEGVIKAKLIKNLSRVLLLPFPGVCKGEGAPCRTVTSQADMVWDP